MDAADKCTAFCGQDRIASGPLLEVALKAKAVVDNDKTAQVLVFDDITAHPIDVDFRGTPEDVLRRLEQHSRSVPQPAGGAPRGRGRPKLGVVAREVTLLPRHWDWLQSRPGGASVTLRKLVEDARRAKGGEDRVRQAQEAAYRFMVAMAGDAPGFEEASRALFAGNKTRFDQEIQAWPSDVRDHARALATAAFEGQVST
jgi:hypothetical protein